MLRTLLVLGILVPGIVVALWSRFTALCLYIWFALFRPEEWMWMDIRDYRPSLILGLLVLVPSLIQGILPNLTHPLSIGAVMFLGTALLAQENAIVAETGWFWLDFLARLLLICLLTITIVNTRQRFVWLAGVIAVSFGFHSAKAGLASLMGGGVRFAEGLAGAFVDNNGYALGTAMILPFLLHTAQNAPLWWLRRGFTAAIPLSMFTIVSTFSRGGLLAMGCAVATYILLQRRRATTAIVVVALAFTIIPLIPLPAGYTERVETIRTYEEVEEDSALARLHFWRVAVDMAVAHPTGVGLHNYSFAYDTFDFLDGRHGHGRSVHSSHFQVLAEQGFLGAFLWVALFAYAIVLCLRIRSRGMNERLPADERHFLFTSANALIVSMVAFLVGGAFIALALNDLTWLTFALVASLDRISKEMIRRVPEPVATRAEELPAINIPRPKVAVGR